MAKFFLISCKKVGKVKFGILTAGVRASMIEVSIVSNPSGGGEVREVD